MAKLRKIMALAILAIFLLSFVPLAFAEEDNSSNVSEEQVPAENVSVGEPAEEQAPAEEQEQPSDEGTNETSEEDQTEGDDQTAETNGHGKKLVKRVKTVASEKIQSRLTHLVSVILNVVDRLKQRIESSKMSDDEKTQLMGSLDEQVGQLEDIQDELSAEMTKEDFRAVIKDIKDTWKGLRPKLKLGVGKLIGAKLGNIIVKVERLEAKLDKIRDRLSEKGYDVSTLDEYLSGLSEKMDSAKEDWETAKEKFKEGNVKEAHQFQMKARNTIKDVREDIRKIVKEIKGLNKVEAKDKENQTEEQEQPSEEDQAAEQEQPEEQEQPSEEEQASDEGTNETSEENQAEEQEQPSDEGTNETSGEGEVPEE